jgi:hypothetical protein
MNVRRGRQVYQSAHLTLQLRNRGTQIRYFDTNYMTTNRHLAGARVVHREHVHAASCTVRIVGPTVAALSR